jgi:hypothetical protein
MIAMVGMTPSLHVDKATVQQALLVDRSMCRHSDIRREMPPPAVQSAPSALAYEVGLAMDRVIGPGGAVGPGFVGRRGQRF